MSEFDLYCFAESGNAFKVALMLELSDADWNAKKIDFFKGEHHSPLYKKINDLGEVPALIHHQNGHDQTVSQSAVILLYLAERLGKFGAATESERWEILKWLFFDNHKFTPANSMARSMRIYMLETDNKIKAMWAEKAKTQNTFLNTFLAGREWLVADRPTIADISLSGYLVWPEDIGLNWSDYPNIKRWLNRLQALPGWAKPEEIMPQTLFE